MNERRHVLIVLELVQPYDVWTTTLSILTTADTITTLCAQGLVMVRERQYSLLKITSRLRTQKINTQH